MPDFSARPPVAITGMHRSGTSMVAKLLHQAGLYLGAEQDLMPAAEQNAEGFFEHLRFVNLNDEVLNAAGAGWDCPPPPEFAWDGAALAPFRERAGELAGAFTGVATWGWKDPRTSLTLPFWRSVLGPLRVVVVIRNPLEVVSSLHRRNGFSFALGLTLWQIYAERVLADTQPADRLFTHYDAYFLDPAREITRLIDFLDLARDQDGTELAAAAVPGLRHHLRTARELETNGFPPGAIDLYRRLCQEAEWWEGAAQPDVPLVEQTQPLLSARPVIARGIGNLDLLRVENDVLQEMLRRVENEFTTVVADREQRIAELERALKEHEGMRAELDGRVAERDGRLIERNALLGDRQRVIGALQQQLTQYGSEIERLRARVAGLEDQLAASERERGIASVHEREQRSLLTSLQAVQLHRDAEIMGTLGAVLSRHAPGSPAAIYHRQLVQQVRRLAETHLPVGAATLVAAYGDEAMLDLGDRLTEHFPRSPGGIAADYTDVSDEEAVAQLEARRAEGAAYLLVPGTALPWLASHRALDRHLATRYPVLAQERGIVTIYDLGLASR